MSEISQKTYLYGSQSLTGGTIVTGGQLMVGYNENDEIVGGGIANQTVVSGAFESGAFAIDAVGTSDAAVVFDGLEMGAASAIVSGAVSVKDLVLNDGGTFIARNVPDKGATAQINITNVVVNKGANLYTNMFGSGETSGTEWNFAYVNNLTVNKGGFVGVSRSMVSGGTVNSGTLAGWHATFNDIVVSGGIFSGTGGSNTMNRITIMAGQLQLNSGKADDVVVSGGTFNVKGTNGNMGVSNFVMYDGVANLRGNYYSAKGSTGKWWANTYDGITVSGGVMTISGGNFTNGLNVYGGTVNFKTLTPSSETTLVSSGAYLKGNINIAGGDVTIDDMANAAWIDDSGATWNFILNDRAATDPALITDFGFSTNAGAYQVSVAGAQASGTYAIAGGASALDGKTFTLSVAGLEVAGGITVNGPTVSTSTGDYTLSLTDGNLSLAVVAGEFTPVMLYKNGELVASGISFNNITLGGADYDAVSIGEGGTVTNLTYIDGAISVNGGLLDGMTVAAGTSVDVDYEVSNLDATSATQVKILAGGVVNGGIFAEGTNGTIFISKGGILNGGTVQTTNSNSFRIYGTANDLTIVKGAVCRMETGGVVSGATASGTLKMFNGVVKGNVQVVSGGKLDLAYQLATFSSATVNLDGSLSATHGNCTAAKHPLIMSDSVFNVLDNGAMTIGVEFEVQGTLNFKGGYLNNTSITAGHEGMTIGSGANLNFYVNSAYSSSAKAAYRGFDNGTGGNSCNMSVVVEGTPLAGSYYLISEASSFDRTIALVVDGSTVSAGLAVDESVTYKDTTYKLKNDSGNIVLSVSGAVTPVILYEGSTVAFAGESYSGAVLDNNPYTKLTVNEGGTVTDTIVRKGGTFAIAGGVANGLVFSGGKVELTDGTVNNMVIESGAAATVNNNVNGLSGTASLKNAVLVMNTVNDIDVNASFASGVFVSGTLNGGTVHAVANGLVVASTGLMTDVNVYGSTRISGCVSGANVYYDDVNQTSGTLKTFLRGWLDGEINVYSGARIEIASATEKMAHAEGQILGTVNLYDGGAIYAFHAANTNAKIGSDAVVNVYKDSVISQYNTALTIDGTVNLAGGYLRNNVIYPDPMYPEEEGCGIILTNGKLNYNLVGVVDGNVDAFVANYNNIEGKDYFDCTLDVDTVCYGSYKLAGEASDFGGRWLHFAINGDVVESQYFVDDTYNYNEGERIYKLVINDDDELVLQITTEKFDATAAAPTTVTAGVAQAFWGTDTTYTAGRIYAGNTAAERTRVIIDNTDATGTNGVYVFGGAANSDLTGMADILLYQGSIGAIMGGAKDAAHSVGAVRVQVGGGSETASTGVVYGGGFGSVTGDVDVVLHDSSVVAGQVYGGPMVSSGASAVVGGTVTLELAGGEVKKDVIGGARVQADGISTTTIGAVSVRIIGTELTGDADTGVYGAGWVFGKAATASRAEGADYSVGGVTMSITSDVAIGSASGRGVFGGALAADYAIAQVEGSVAISVTGPDELDPSLCTVTNIYGGGWAQSGAQSNVLGDVSIRVINATVSSIVGGGAHSNAAEVAGSTNVGGNVSITVTNSTVDSIVAVGQSAGDTVVGSATVTLSGTSTVGSVYGVGHMGVGFDNDTQLNMNSFTGTISSAVKHFDTVSFAGDSIATIQSNAEVEGCSGWSFALNKRTLPTEELPETAEAVLTWSNGSFAAEEVGGTSIDIYLDSANAYAWKVCDLSGNDTKTNAFENVSFNLYNGDAAVIVADYKLGSAISETTTAWDGWKLDYDKKSGILAFAQA